MANRALVTTGSAMIAVGGVVVAVAAVGQSQGVWSNAWVISGLSVAVGGFLVIVAGLWWGRGNDDAEAPPPTPAHHPTRMGIKSRNSTWDVQSMKIRNQDVGIDSEGDTWTGEGPEIS